MTRGWKERPACWNGLTTGKEGTVGVLSRFFGCEIARPRFALFLETLLPAFAKPSCTHDGLPCEHLLTAAHLACVPAFAILTYS
jgi:hypothetical protein